MNAARQFLGQIGAIAITGAAIQRENLKADAVRSELEGETNQRPILRGHYVKESGLEMVTKLKGQGIRGFVLGNGNHDSEAVVLAQEGIKILDDAIKAKRGAPAKTTLVAPPR